MKERTSTQVYEVVKIEPRTGKMGASLQWPAP